MKYFVLDFSQNISKNEDLVQYISMDFDEKTSKSRDFMYSIPYEFFPARRPQAGDAGLETGYPEKICHHDDDDDDGQKITPLIIGAQFSFWSFFIDFEFMSNFFVAQDFSVSFETWNLQNYTMIKFI